MGIYRNCPKEPFHAWVSWPAPIVAGSKLSAPQIDIAGLPNVFMTVIFLTTDKRYCNIESVLLTPGIPGDCALGIQKKESSSLFIASKTEGQALPLKAYYHGFSGMSTMIFIFFELDAITGKKQPL